MAECSPYDGVYTAGMERVLPRPVAMRQEHGLLGQPICVGCRMPYHPLISDAAVDPILTETEDDFMDGFRPPYCTRCRMVMRMQCDLMAGATVVTP